ncbi:MAG TPA: hypothetical protein VFF67_07675 [Thermoplasmata archaeon]|nr:hypothetical protein [Thermoplasmata archaeon]
MLTCPFCGSPETDRIDLEGHRFLVFGCMFTPEVDPTLDDSAIAERLPREFGSDGSGYFRQQCDRLHLFATRGASPPVGHLRPVD